MSARARDRVVLKECWQIEFLPPFVGTVLQMDAYRRRGGVCRRRGGRLNPALDDVGSMLQTQTQENAAVLSVLITVNMIFLFCFVSVITEHLLSPSATLSVACAGAVAVFKSPRFTYLSLSSQRHCSLINNRGAEQST